MQNNIVHTWFFPHAPERVWEYLTDSTLLSEWLMENDIQPVVGHRFQFSAKPKVKIGFDGNIYCEVLEVVPLKKFSYSWKGGPRAGKITLDSVVTWTLTPADGGTRVVLEHTGFKGLKNYISYLIMNKGWLKIAKRLAAKLQSHVISGS